MAKKLDGPGYATGRDAAYIEPKFVPSEQLLPRDDSGGDGFEPYTAQWGDGGFVTGGAKSYLSASGGSMESSDGDEESRKPRRGDGPKGMKRMAENK